MKDLIQEGRRIQERFKRLVKEDFSPEEKKELENKIKSQLVDGKYLYHYTATENRESIENQGLIPAKNPDYKGAEGVFLTTKTSLYRANLPQRMMDLMDDYYEYQDDYDEKPIVRLKIDVSKLDLSKFTWDDDYILNKYGYNKAETNVDKVIESLDTWGSIAYSDKIPPSAIIDYDFDYEN